MKNSPVQLILSYKVRELTPQILPLIILKSQSNLSLIWLKPHSIKTMTFYCLFHLTQQRKWKLIVSILAPDKVKKTDRFNSIVIKTGLKKLQVFFLQIPIRFLRFIYVTETSQRWDSTFSKRSLSNSIAFVDFSSWITKERS